MTPLALLLTLVVFIAAWVTWLTLVFIFPAKWAQFVDWEHAWLLKRGLLSQAVSPELKRLETGIVMKTALSGTILLALMALCLVVGRYFLGLRI